MHHEKNMHLICSGPALLEARLKLLLPIHERSKPKVIPEFVMQLGFVDPWKRLKEHIFTCYRCYHLTVSRTLKLPDGSTFGRHSFQAKHFCHVMPYLHQSRSMAALGEDRSYRSYRSYRGLKPGLPILWQSRDKQHLQSSASHFAFLGACYF